MKCFFFYSTTDISVWVYVLDISASFFNFYLEDTLVKKNWFCFSLRSGGWVSSER